MSFVELLGFLALGAIVWYWFDSLKAREIGVDAARRACARSRSAGARPTDRAGAAR